MTHLLTTEASSALRVRAGGAYRARLAETASDLAAAQALRFEVFNLELDEGLVQSYDSGLDSDPFDAVCTHLIVEELASGAVVGTYRMQTGRQAHSALGYYSEREFDFSPFEAQRSRILELGRACIDRRHRNFAVLNLLWKGIAAHARDQGARYLMGCSSLTSQDAAVGAAAYARLLPHLSPAAWRTAPREDVACSLHEGSQQAVHIPRLLSAYLTLGACICGPPAIDREFRTIDFLTWIDVESPALVAMQRRGRFTA
jgi:putative hemolysin